MELAKIVDDLKANIYQREVKVDSNDTECQKLTLKIDQLTTNLKDFEGKIKHEGEALMRARLNIKELEKKNVAAKLAYELLTEQHEISINEKEKIVILKTK